MSAIASTGTAAKQKQMEQDRDRIIRLESDVDGLKEDIGKLGRNVEHIEVKLEENFARLFRSKDAENKDRIRESQDKGKVWIGVAFGVFGVIVSVSSLNYWAIQATVKPSEIAIEYAQTERMRMESTFRAETARNIEHIMRSREADAVQNSELLNLKSEVERLREKTDTAMKTALSS